MALLQQSPKNDAVHDVCPCLKGPQRTPIQAPPGASTRCACAANARTSSLDSTCSTAPAHATLTCRTALNLRSFQTLTKPLK